MDAKLVPGLLTGMINGKPSWCFHHSICVTLTINHCPPNMVVIISMISTSSFHQSKLLKKLSSVNHFPLRILVYSPLFVPPAPDVGPGDDTTARYVGGGGGGGVLLLPWLASVGEVRVSPPSSLGWVVSVFLHCSSWDRTRGGGMGLVAGSSAGGVTAGGVLALGAGAGGMLVGESRAGGEEAGGDESSFGGAVGGESLVVRGPWSSGVGGPAGAGGAAGSTEGGGEVGRGGTGSTFAGGEVGSGGAGSSGGGGDVGKGGAGDSGGGGEAGSGGAGSSGGGGRSADSSEKQTHVSSLSSPAGGACSGPKMLSKSAIEGFLVEPSASVVTSETQTSSDQLKAVYADALSMFTHKDNILTDRKR